MSAWLPGTRSQWIALSISLPCMLACLLSGLTSPRQALLSYLFAFLFFTGLSLGSLALVFVHVLTGGAWGNYLRPQLLAAAHVLPLLALLVLPILLGMHALYPWTDAGLLSRDPLLRAQAWYLNPTFFVMRTIGYFVLWLALLWMTGRWAADPRRVRTLPRLAAAGLIAYGLSTLPATTDWAMSLLPHWHSSSFGMMVATGWLLSAAALAILCALKTHAPSDMHPPPLLPDLGNLLLMFVLAWSYLAFMQYLTIWVADLPAETAWYISRTTTSWRALAGFLILFQFAVPFAILLSRRAKRYRASLGTIAALLLFAGLADALWVTVPDFRTQGIALRWTDLFAVAGIGALWWCAYYGQIRNPTRYSVTNGRPPSLEAAHG